MADDSRAEALNPLYHGHRDDAFDQRGHRKHHQQKSQDSRPQRHAGGQQFAHRQERRDHHRHCAGGEDRGLPMPAGSPQAVGQIAGEHSGDGHVENVGAQRQDSAVLEHEGLHGQDGGHDDACGRGADRDGQQCPAHQVRAGARGHRKVDHLGGEDEGPHDAQQRRASFLEVAPGAAGEYNDRGQDGGVEGEPDRRREESVGDVHRVPRYHDCGNRATRRAQPARPPCHPRARL